MSKDLQEVLGPPEPALLSSSLCTGSGDVRGRSHPCDAFFPQIQVIATPKSHISINVVTGKN